MDQQNILFQLGLGLDKPWTVVRSGLEKAQDGTKFLYLDIDFEEGAKFACPCCGKPSPVYDSEVKRWRHLNFWQHATYLSARVPRINCQEHKIKQVTLPWAREGSGFTLLFEAFVMALVRDMPVSAAAELVGEHDTRLWRILRHYVDEAHARQDWSKVKAVAIDETATRKGHRYATVVVELDPQGQKPGRLLFMTQDRTAASVGEFATAMVDHSAKPEQISQVAIDMSAAFRKGVAEYLPEAKTCFDRFHVMQLAGKAVDIVRKSIRDTGAQLTGSLWALRGNWHNLKEHQQKARQDLCSRFKELGRALALRENLQETWEWPGRTSAEIHLKGWHSWAVRSRLPAFVKLAKTIKSHWDGILGFFPDRITSAAIEAINGVIQTARRRARGFRNFANFRAIAYWMAADLDIKIPAPFTHPK